MRYFARLRHDWILETLNIFGSIRREHVTRKFGVTEQVASSDFQTVLESYPSLMSYNTSTKQYERCGDYVPPQGRED